jgi:hypothetical protein
VTARVELAAAIRGTLDAPPLPVRHADRPDAVRMAAWVVALVSMLAVGCVELEATGLPNTPTTFGIEKDCTATITCRGEPLRWDLRVCGLASEDSTSAIGETCDAWVLENCPEWVDVGIDLCEVECLPRAKACPVYDGEIEWPPVDAAR